MQNKTYINFREVVAVFIGFDSNLEAYLTVLKRNLSAVGKRN